VHSLLLDPVRSSAGEGNDAKISAEATNTVAILFSMFTTRVQ
jgi:hypothetical protein